MSARTFLGPWTLEPWDIQALDSIPLEDIPLRLASFRYDGYHNYVVDTRWYGPGHYTEGYWRTMVIPYLSKRLEMGI